MKVNASNKKWKITKVKIGDSIRSISLDKSATLAYLGCEDGSIKIINLKAERIDHMFTAHTSCIRHICLFKDWLISSSNDKSIKIFSKTNFSLVGTLYGHTNSVAAFSRFKLYDEESIVTFILCLKHKFNAEKNGSMEKKNGSSKTIYYIPKMLIKKICGHSRINYLVSGSYDTTLKIWTLENFCCLTSWVAHLGIIRCLYIIDNKYLISGSYDNTIKVWDLKNLIKLMDPEKCLIKTITVHKGPIFCFARHKNLFFSGSKDKRIVVFEINKDFQVLQVIKKAHSSWVWSISVLSSKTFYSTSADKTIKIWKRKKKKPNYKFSSVDSLCGHKDQVFCIAPLNKTKFITGGFDKTLRIWKKIKSQKRKPGNLKK